MRDADTKTRGRLWWTAAVIAASLVVLAGCGSENAESRKETARADVSRAEADTTLPRLVDLGRGTCIPCKKMAPILEELSREYAGKAVIEVVDLREAPEAAEEYGIRLIPTQIFFDAYGREVWRHEGFLSRDAIVAKLAQMGAEPLGN
jgi:thioredoxin 1